MPCHSPLTAYFSNELNSSGKRSLVFNPSRALQRDEPFHIACGVCVGCRLERSRQWAVRILHEAKKHEHNSFVTLTYAPEHLPSTGLQKHHYQKWIRALRKKIKKPVRYYVCGEYGDDDDRPHYHVCLFGEDFSSDRKKLKKTKHGHQLYKSALLDSTWNKGFANIGELTFESAAYVARYVLKKRLGPETSIKDIYLPSGEIRQPEFGQPSLKPGIGADWHDTYGEYFAKHGFIVVNGKKATPPKYYQKRLEQFNPELYDEYEFLKKGAYAHAHVLTQEEYKRLDVKAKLQFIKQNQLKRNFS